MGSTFVALEVAIEAAGVVNRLLDQLGPRHRDLVEQGKSAVNSVPLNLAEGNDRAGRDRQNHFNHARSTAGETIAVLRVAVAAGGFKPDQPLEAIALLDRVRAMTWRLLHPRR